jgi:hypothetical protein
MLRAIGGQGDVGRGRPRRVRKKPRTCRRTWVFFFSPGERGGKQRGRPSITFDKRHGSICHECALSPPPCPGDDPCPLPALAWTQPSAPGRSSCSKSGARAPPALRGSPGGRFPSTATGSQRSQPALRRPLIASEPAGRRLGGQKGEANSGRPPSAIQHTISDTSDQRPERHCRGRHGAPAGAEHEGALMKMSKPHFTIKMIKVRWGVFCDAPDSYLVREGTS